MCASVPGRFLPCRQACNAIHWQSRIVSMRAVHARGLLVHLPCAGGGLVAFRDPNGIRPLVLGTRLTEHGPEWCVASEDCAFGPIGFKRVRDVQPGEMVIVTEEGDLVCSQCVEQRLCPCIFEYIYLARPDSVLNKISVYALPSLPHCAWVCC